jgi:hypothetical protein
MATVVGSWLEKIAAMAKPLTPTAIVGKYPNRRN